MRIMGLDYGSKTVGVAVSDALGLTAQGIEIVRRKSENKLRQTLARIEEIAKESVAAIIHLINKETIEKEILLPVHFIQGNTTKRQKDS